MLTYLAEGRLLVDLPRAQYLAHVPGRLVSIILYNVPLQPVWTLSARATSI